MNTRARSGHQPPPGDRRTRARQTAGAGIHGSQHLQVHLSQPRPSRTVAAGGRLPAGFISPASGDHFYTTSAAERDNAVAELGYLNEGVACHVYPEPVTR